VWCPFALALIAIGVIGLVAPGTLSQTPLTFNPPQGVGPFGMMGPGGMGGMMGRYGPGYIPNVNATPVPSSRPVDADIQITTDDFQFHPARMTVRAGSTVRFIITNKTAHPGRARPMAATRPGNACEGGAHVLS